MRLIKAILNWWEELDNYMDDRFRRQAERRIVAKFEQSKRLQQMVWADSDEFFDIRPVRRPARHKETR